MSSKTQLGKNLPQRGRKSPFRTVKGRDVSIAQLHIRVSDLGYLAGSSAVIRAGVLRDLPDEVQNTFGPAGLLVRKPRAGHLPQFTFFLELKSSPMNPKYDCSKLVVVWFADTLPQDLPQEVASKTSGIVWEKHAKDCQF